MGLGCEAVVRVRVRIRIGFSIRAEDCLAGGFFVKDCVRGGFKVSFWVKISFEVFVKMGQY